MFECTGCYWALEDEFYYPMTPCDCCNNKIVQTMTIEREHHINEGDTLINDLQVPRAPIQHRRMRTMDRNGTIQLCQALNYIHEENNRMTIQRNRYSMRKELFCTTSEHGKSMNPNKVAQVFTVPECKSDTKSLIKIMKVIKLSEIDNSIRLYRGKTSFLCHYMFIRCCNRNSNAANSTFT